MSSSVGKGVGGQRQHLLGKLELGDPDPPGAGVDQLLAVGAAHRRLDHLHAASGADDPRLDRDRPDRDRAEDLQGDPADVESLAPSSDSISRPISAEGGPACWWPGSQGPRVSSVAQEALAVGLEESLRHGPILFGRLQPTATEPWRSWRRWRRQHALHPPSTRQSMLRVCPGPRPSTHIRRPGAGEPGEPSRSTPHGGAVNHGRVSAGHARVCKMLLPRSNATVRRTRNREI